jgi:hypothetical protein
MDILWARLSDRESRWIRDLSADLNTLGRSAPPEESPKLDDATRRRLGEAEASGDWEGLRADVSRNPDALPAHAAAFVRAQRWEALDEPCAAFLEEATRLAPNISLYSINSTFRSLYSSIKHFLEESIGRAEEAEVQARGRKLKEEFQRIQAEAYRSESPAA